MEDTNELSPLSIVYCLRGDLAHITKDMNEYELQFLEDAINIKRHKIICNKLAKYGVYAKYVSFNDDGTVNNYYNYIAIRSGNTVIHTESDKTQRLLDILANTTPAEAIKRWLKSENFEEWQIEARE